MSICPFCSSPAKRVPWNMTYKRSGRVLLVTVEAWQCPTGCLGPDAEEIYAFIDSELSKENEAKADEAWQKAFGELMPKRKSDD